MVSVAVCAAAYGLDLNRAALCVAANAGWWITQGFGVQLNDKWPNEHARFSR